MRHLLFVTLALAAVGSGTARLGTAAEPPKLQVELKSELIGVLGLPLEESTKPVYAVRLTAQVDEKGEGNGTLVLDPTGLPAYDEFGFPGAAPVVPAVKLDCTLKLVKKTVKSYTSRRLGAPESETVEIKEEWRLYAIKGPKINSRLFLAMVDSRHWVDGRFLVQGTDGRVKYVVDLHMPPPPEPCHPGCFPAGTRIAVPGGTKGVEDVGAGDSVTTINAEGVSGQTKVLSVFVTRNRLLRVRTDGGTLVTTATQPLSLANGDLRAAGALQAGDRIHTWDGLKRRDVAVRDVTDADRNTQVFNLILGDSALFIADGFLARSKPPATDTSTDANTPQP